MTLCIAAECYHDGKNAIAMCSDLRRQTGSIDDQMSLIGSEDIYKMLDWNGATAMLAGDPTEAKELASACRHSALKFVGTRLDTANFDLNVTTFLEELRVAARHRKRQIVNHYVEMRLGLTYGELQKLPHDNYIDTWIEIKNLTLGAELLICAVGYEPVIVRLDRFGGVHWENHYFAIGSGAEIARAFLCLQPWYASKSHHSKSVRDEPEKVPLAECIYRIYEAKQAAHVANPSSIGNATTYQILFHDGRATVADGLHAAVENYFDSKHRVPALTAAFNPDQLLIDQRGFA